LSDLFDTLRDALADRYAMEREVGRGGMATVYLAEDLKHRRKVAIKVLHPDISAAIGPDRFLREIEIAARLQHPHILPLYDSGEAAGSLFYVMPFVEGESLRDRLDREKQLPQEDVIKITSEVASALGYAHSHDVVHRDIKPENIMLSGGSAVVADFGIARAASAVEQQQLTQTGTVIGTPAYMSTEQSTGDAIDGRSDQYSLACVVYEMLVGQPPFTGPNVQAIIARHSMAVVSPPSIVRDTIPETMEAALMRALAKVPADRFPTVIMFAEALAAPSTVTAAVRRRTGEGPARPKRAGGWQRRLLWAVPAVVLLAVAAWGARRLLAPKPSGGAAQGALEPRNIAVGYFDDLSRDSSLGYLADGLTEALIDQLGSAGLKVISKNGVAVYRGSTLSEDSIARALHVGSLIRGSVEALGGRVRVTARLVDGASGADVDRQSFEEPSGNLLAVRDTLVQRVAGFLRTRLGQEVRVREQRAGTSNLQAWVLVQQAEKSRKDAEAFLVVDSLAGAERAFARADTLGAQAAALDPQWVEPEILRAGIAYRESRLAESDPKAAVEHIEHGLRHAARALEIAPNDPRALEQRGTLRYWHYILAVTPDPTERAKLLSDARQDLETAVGLDPTLASAHATLSHLYYQFDDVAAAILAARRAYEEDAYLSVANLVLYRLVNGSLDLEQFTQAQRWCDEGGRRFPQDFRFAECQLDLLVTPGVAPDVGRAWQEVARLDTLAPADRRAYERLYGQLRVGGVLARAGQSDSARNVLRRARAGLTRAVDPNEDLTTISAFSYLLLGDKTEAIAILKRFAAGHPGHFEPGVDLGWWWRSLQDDPRFQALVGARSTR
jgi:serine/threonine-protein kinase